MTARQTIELKRLEIQKRLGTIAGLQGDDLTTEIEAERDGLMVEMRSSIGQLEAAIVAEAAETRGASAVERLDDGESAEYRGLVERSKLSAYVLESHRQGGLDGAESELRAAVFGDRSRPGLVPWEVLLPMGKTGSRFEERVDANTNITVNAGGTQETILGRIFADTAASFLGVRMASVERGVSAHPVITAGVTPTQTAKGSKKDAEAATVNITTLEPRRLTARYSFAQEDLARVDGLEEGLRMDLAGALGEALDGQVVAGDGSGSNVRGFLTEIDAADVPGDAATYSLLLTAVSAGVDGRAARNLSEIRTIAGVDSYQLAAGLVATGSDLAAVDYLMERSGGFRASAHVPPAPTSGLRSGIGELLLYRTMAPSSATAVLWSGFELMLRDEISKAAEGRVALTALALWNFAVVREAAYTRAAIQIA